MCVYLRLLGSLAQNLFRRVGDDLADCTVFVKRGCVYKMRCLRRKFDDVGPNEGDVDPYVALPEHQAELISGLEKFIWFQHMDRRTAQDHVHRGGQGCFIVRPSSSTRSLTLTLWHENRSYNILVRRRDDGLIALGSKKHNELVFRTVEEMCNHYSRNELILYSGGELTGKTLLKLPAQVILQQPISSSLSPEGIKHDMLVLKTSLDITDNSPRTLEESVHRAAQRSMSLKTFRELKTNHERNTSSERLVNDHHKSYENVMSNWRHNLNFQNRSLRNSFDTFTSKTLQTDDKQLAGYENITPEISAVSEQKTEFNHQSTGVNKKNTQDKRPFSTSSDSLLDPKRIKSDSTSVGLIEVSPQKCSKSQTLSKNSEISKVDFKNFTKNSTATSAPTDIEEEINENFKPHDNEKTDQKCTSKNSNFDVSITEQVNGSLLSQKLTYKSQSLELLNEKIHQNTLTEKKTISGRNQLTPSHTSLEKKNLEQDSKQPKAGQKTLPLLNPIVNSINTNIKSSLASTEFVSKVVQNTLLDDSTKENVLNPTENSTARNEIVQKTVKNLEHNDKSEINTKQSYKPLDIFKDNIDQTGSQGVTLSIINETSRQNNYEKYGDTLTKSSYNFNNKFKEPVFVSTPILQSRSQSFKSEEYEYHKSTLSFPTVPMKETLSQSNEKHNPGLLSTEKKLNKLNSKKIINDKELFESKLNKILSRKQEPNFKSPKEAANKAKLVVSFFEELSKKNQT